MSISFLAGTAVGTPIGALTVIAVAQLARRRSPKRRLVLAPVEHITARHQPPTSRQQPTLFGSPCTADRDELAGVVLTADFAWQRDTRPPTA